MTILLAHRRHPQMMTRWILVAALLLLAPVATAQINGPSPYAADYGFADPNTADYTTLLSGRLEATTAGSTGPYGFFETVGLRIDGLEKVCRGKTGAACWEGDLSLVVNDGGSIGIQFLTRPAATYTADHALGMFLDARGDDLNSLPLNQSLLAPAVNGRMEFREIRHLASASPFGFDLPSATLSPTASNTSFTLLQGSTPLYQWTGKSEVVRMYGPADIPAFSTDFVVLPFKEGSTARFTPADPAAAQLGLDFERLDTVFEKLNDASAGGGTSGRSEVPDNPLEETLSEVLDGALLRFPTPGSNASADGFALVLFKSMEVSNEGGQLAWAGQAGFRMEGAKVSGAQPLYGVYLFQLPWWGWGLWLVAIGLFVTRLVLNPEKHHERWDRYRWIGWVAGAVAFVGVFLLWDLEMRAVWGTSVLTTKTVGTAFWITFGLQLGTMAFVMGAVSWPVSMIIKNGLLISKQGTFMGLGKPLSLVLAYALGATLMLAYMQLFMAQVIARIPS